MDCRLSAALMVIAVTSLQSAASSEPAQDIMSVAVPLTDVQVSRQPAPRRGHVLTLRFAGSPAAPEDLGGSADYEVANVDCVAIDYGRAIGGVRLPPRHSVPLAWVRGDDGAYTATLHEDALLDADYYGLGVCRWALRTATVRFRSPVTHFIGGIQADAILSGKPLTQHFLVRDLEHKPGSMDVVYGEPPDFYLTNAGEQFTLTLSAHKEAH